MVKIAAMIVPATLMALMSVTAVAEDYSPVMVKKYQRRRSTGVSLAVVGGLTMVASPVFLAASFSRGGIDDYKDDHDPGYYNEYQEDRLRTSRGLFAGGLISLVGGGLMLGIGITLAVSGRSGIKRQEYLLRKDEALGPLRDLRIGLQADPSTGKLGIGISVTF